MKYFYKNIIWFLFIFLIIVNMYLFVSGINLSNQIVFFEKETKKLHQENIELSNRIYHYNSLEYASSMAAVLNFVKKSAPVILENLKYARNW